MEEGPRQEERGKDPKLFRETQPGRLDRLKTETNQRIESHGHPSRSLSVPQSTTGLLSEKAADSGPVEDGGSPLQVRALLEFCMLSSESSELFPCLSPRHQ